MAPCSQTSSLSSRLVSVPKAKVYKGVQGVTRPVSESSVESMEDPLESCKPAMDGYHQGVWCPIKVKEERSERYLVHFEGTDEDDEVWLQIHEMRLRTREADDWDCRHILKRNVDVCVASSHLQAHLYRSLNLQAGWSDAKIVSIERRPHLPYCECRFSVQFFEVCGSQTGRYETMGLSKHASKVVDISRINILQMPFSTPTISASEILQACMSNGNGVPGRRWSSDAIFLHETRLTIVKGPSVNIESSERAFLAEKIQFEDEETSTPDGVPGLRRQGETSLPRALDDVCFRRCRRYTSEFGAKNDIGRKNFSPQTANRNYEGNASTDPPGRIFYGGMPTSDSQTVRNSCETMATPDGQCQNPVGGATADVRDETFKSAFMHGPDLASNLAEEESPSDTSGSNRSGVKGDAGESSPCNTPHQRTNGHVNGRPAKGDVKSQKEGLVGANKRRVVVTESTEDDAATSQEGIEKQAEQSSEESADDSKSSLEPVRKRGRIIQQQQETEKNNQNVSKKQKLGNNRNSGRVLRRSGRWGQESSQGNKDSVQLSPEKEKKFEPALKKQGKKEPEENARIEKVNGKAGKRELLTRDPVTVGSMLGQDGQNVGGENESANQDPVGGSHDRELNEVLAKGKTCKNQRRWKPQKAVGGLQGKDKIQSNDGRNGEESDLSSFKKEKVVMSSGKSSGLDVPDQRNQMRKLRPRSAGKAADPSRKSEKAPTARKLEKSMSSPNKLQKAGKVKDKVAGESVTKPFYQDLLDCAQRQNVKEVGDKTCSWPLDLRIGLKEDWDPFKPDSNSDSDCQIISRSDEDPIWQEMQMALDGSTGWRGSDRRETKASMGMAAVVTVI